MTTFAPNTGRGLVEHIVRLLVGRHKGEGLPEPGSMLFLALFFAYLLTSAVKRIVGVADAGPIGAVFVPLLLLAVVWLVSVVRRPVVLSAFMLISFGLNTLLVLSIAAGLNHRWYQWALDFWLYGASAYFAYSLPEDLPEPLPNVPADDLALQAEPQTPEESVEVPGAEAEAEQSTEPEKKPVKQSAAEWWNLQWRRD